MSILVRIQQEPALCDGEIIEIGECARVPNATAIGWKKRGRAIDANGSEHLENTEKRRAKRAHSKAEIEKREKGNKGRR